MNKPIVEMTNKIDKILNKKTCIEINFANNNFLKSIPKTPGWYFFSTDMPVEKLVQVKKPRGHKSSKIISFKKVIEANNASAKLGFAINHTPRDAAYFIVYNGEAKNLKNRISSHYKGYSGTGCLGLKKQIGVQHFNWMVNYVTIDEFQKQLPDDKSVRVILEQAWRIQHGWPILCKK